MAINRKYMFSKVRNMKKIIAGILFIALLATAAAAIPAGKHDKITMKLKEVPLIEVLKYIPPPMQ